MSPEVRGKYHERQYSLLLALVAGGLLDTYLEQVGALTNVLMQLALLTLVLDQRSRRTAQGPPVAAP